MNDFRRMEGAERFDAFQLLRASFADEHYRSSSAAYGDGGEAALGRALNLFIERPDYGFVWLGYDDAQAIACCVVSYAISTSIGAVVAKLDDVFVVTERRNAGVGAELIGGLISELRGAGIARIDTAVHLANEGARRFYERLGFVSLREERLACVL